MNKNNGHDNECNGSIRQEEEPISAIEESQNFLKVRVGHGTCPRVPPVSQKNGGTNGNCQWIYCPEHGILESVNDSRLSTDPEVFT